MALAATVVRMNRAGVREMLSSSDVRDALAPHAERVLAAARSGAPVRTGRYRDSLTIRHDTTDRAVERVVATVSYGMVVESRTGNLARAMGTV